MPVPTSSSRSSFHPQFASSLSYAAVRDFAYPSAHPLHYGPSAIPSGLTTPLADLQEAVSSSGSTWFTTTNPDSNGFRRLSDPVTIQSTDSPWGDTAQFRHRLTNQPPPLKFSDGPPWSEDEDLQSPVVVAKPFAHGKKHKSSMPLHTRGLSKNSLALDGGEWDSARRRSTGGGVVESGESYYTTRAGAQDLADGEPGGELYHHQQGNVEYNPAGAGYYDPDYVYSDEEEQVGEDSDYSSRFSRDYQFTIASPAEEMHGKAVALFDFVQENENELPLVEGQVVWVSYRHGMGWLVAEDPKTGILSIPLYPPRELY